MSQGAAAASTQRRDRAISAPMTHSGSGKNKKGMPSSSNTTAGPSADRASRVGSGSNSARAASTPTIPSACSRGSSQVIRSRVGSPSPRPFTHR